MGLAGTDWDLEQTLRLRFGLERFRSGQREVIEQVLGGRDVLCVMPTGGGKSLCYQLPALLLPGVTLVVSPLIALMKDQVDALRQKGIEATLINSTLEPGEQLARMVEVEAGRHSLIYVAPERFRSPRFLAVMERIRPSLLAIDEAHCISQWGHDFRPDYARLGLARRQLGSPPCIALTATATDVVRRDIAEQLDLRDPALFVTGFDRPNLRYAVVQAGRDDDKLERLAQALGRNPGPAIVYASSRARCESVAAFLGRELRKEVVVYHAGLDRQLRAEAQERFMRGEAEVVVATNAFGMGVDKPDIRSVVHFNMPGTLEAYYQEAGRAGRDGLDSQCVLLFSPADRILQELFIENEYPPAAVVHQVYEFLRGLDDDPIELTHAEIREAARLDLNDSAVGTVLKILENAGAIEKFLPRENMAIVRFPADPEGPSLVDRLGPQAHVQRTVLIGLEGLVRGRLGEPVYFRPDELAAALGIDLPAFGRAIRALAGALPIDYIPPFRGNAVRVIDRAKRARDLKIDFRALEGRKRREYDKLERMIQYAQSARCRRSTILSYFGDAEAENVRCGSCDRCGPGQGGEAGAAGPMPVDTPEGREVLMKVLSGVARAKGRFGKVVVAQMLTGSDSERMSRWALDRLSTYGILRDHGFTQQEVSRILDALTAEGLIQSQEVDRFKPVIVLTERGWGWLKGQGPAGLALDLPPDLLRKLRAGGHRRGGHDRAPASPHPPAARDEPPPRPTPRAPGPAAPIPAVEGDADDGPADEPLRDRLRRLRDGWARAARKPGEEILPDRAIDELVGRRPSTPAALASVPGLDRSRIERFGAQLLDALAADGPAAPAPAPRRPPGSSPDSPPAGAPPGPAAPYMPTEEWTWRLVDRGFSVEDAAAIRGLEPAVIARHLSWVAARGRPVDVGSFLPPECVDAWDAWRAAHGDSGPPPGPAAPAWAWPLFVACRRSGRGGPDG